MEPRGRCLGVTQCLLAQNLAIFRVQLPSQTFLKQASNSNTHKKLVSNVSEDVVIDTWPLGIHIVGCVKEEQRSGF